MNDPLRISIDTAHNELTEHFDAATAAVRNHLGRRESIQKADAFLIHACRHLSAVCEVILPAARTELPGGEAVVDSYVDQARHTEQAIVQTKRRLYGESHTADLPWSQVWSDLGTEFRRLIILEGDLVADLSIRLDPRTRDALASRMGPVEAGSPTRPHPNSPHTGRLAHASRLILARTDRLWDAAEGRIVSHPATDKLAS
ncbi:hypothetical protein [Aeromicrobium sp.]|uniref:hypothetical protein n=1 Tax=Aeromicrobium sp. TaxID=1871063 RepID=UPI002FC980C1